MPRLSSFSPRRSLSSFVRDEAGMSYTMQLTVALPFCVLFIAVFVEITLMLNTKTGVQHAATAAARAATVWWPAEDLDDDPDEALRRRMGRIHLAAVNALAPFASGSETHANRLGGDFDYPDDAPFAWAEAYRTAGGNHDANFLARKWSYAAGATRVFVEPLLPDSEEEIEISESEDAQTFNSALRVTVEYQMPFHTPGAGRFLGERRGDGLYTKTIRSTAILEKEGPKSAEHTIGFQDYYESKADDQQFLSENAADDLDEDNA